ncbi:TPA: hypothetical protein ACGJWA_002022 [Pseudomonas aeruginosa]|uniref:Phage tail tape measure protein n=1 Tax=Pseudomonas aeruginosa TaxID=287 RepID=A0A6A9JVJ2_PSEAI|nr:MULTISPECIES: hypothetical protein [Pseudomonas]MUI59235.1 hypothetical protein [Pseudomonas aeruginosa]OFR50220.1 hypothetical protein HMPREF2886_11015 [Pseudomonas sp. HMSC066A08]RUE50210.1 hypothetical protein IPC1224_26180 [Pseudomonas aeruginosa]HBO1239485.1 hypothetical protein [Pseudomonas aeruginosa]HBO1878669.1 hypothetical protein [Pseudomonas aeruginosa]
MESTNQPTAGQAKALQEYLREFREALGQVQSVARTVQGTVAALLGGLTGYLDDSLKGLEDLEEGEDALGPIGPDAIRSAQDYRQAVQDVDALVEALNLRVALGLAPTIGNLAERFERFVQGNREALLEGVGKALEVIAQAIDALGNFVWALDEVVGATLGWRTTLTLLGGTLLWLGRTALLAFASNPFSLVIAALAVLILLVDDFVTYLRGGDSLFGGFWGGLRDAVAGVSAFIEENLQGVLAVATFVGTALLTAVPLSSWGAGLARLLLGANLAIGGLLGGIGRFGAALRGVVTVIGLLGNALRIAFLANPVGLLIAAVVTLAVLVALNFERIKAVAAAAWDFIVAKAVAVFVALQELFAPLLQWYGNLFGLVGDLLGGNFSAALERVRALWEQVLGFFQSGIEAIAGLFGGLGDYLSLDLPDLDPRSWLEALGEAAAAMAALLQAALGAAWDALLAKAGEVLEGLRGLFGSLGDWLSGLFGSVGETIVQALGGVFGKLLQLWGDSLASASGLLGKALDALGGLFPASGEGVSQEVPRSLRAVAAQTLVRVDAAQVGASPYVSPPSAWAPGIAPVAGVSPVSNQNVRIDIVTSDPVQAGQTAAAEIQRLNQRATRNYANRFKQ